LNVLGDYFLSHEKSGHILQRERMVALLNQCYSYATCENLSKANAKSTSNEKRRKLMRSTRLGLTFTRFRYLTDFQDKV